MKTTLRLALLYFLLVFTAGFVLGTIRVLFLVDTIGERQAELAEMPVMAIVCALSARYLVTRHRLVLTSGNAVAIGLMALSMLFLIEFTLVTWLRGISLENYIAERDPVSGVAYLAGLAWFALAPLFFVFRRSG